MDLDDDASLEGNAPSVYSTSVLHHPDFYILLDIDLPIDAFKL